MSGLKKFLEEVDYFDKNEAMDAWDKAVSVDDNDLDPYLLAPTKQIQGTWDERPSIVYSSIAGKMIDTTTGLPVEDET